MAKSDNLLAVLWLLRAHRRLTAPQIAEELETSVRTVYRYIDALCASGVPILADAGPDGGYSLAENFKGAPLFFEPAELVALFQAARFAERSGYPYSGALETALAKVKQNLTPQQAGELERHVAGLKVAPVVRGGPVEPWLPLLEQAVASCRTVAMGYQRPDEEEPTSRPVDPYTLTYSNGLWYLSGFCHLRGAVREFRVDRIRSLVLTDSTFDRPAGADREERYSDAWIRERLSSAPLTLLQLQGEPWAMADLWDHWYLRHCRVEKGARTASFQVDPIGQRHLVYELLRYGKSVRLLEPAALRMELAAMAREWARHHEQPEQD